MDRLGGVISSRERREGLGGVSLPACRILLSRKEEGGVAVRAGDLAGGISDRLAGRDVLERLFGTGRVRLVALRRAACRKAPAVTVEDAADDEAESFAGPSFGLDVTWKPVLLLFGFVDVGEDGSI